MSILIGAIGFLSVVQFLPAPVAAATELGVHALEFSRPAWSPYLVGAGIGVLSWLTFYLSDKAIGASSFYAHVSGFVGKWLSKRHTQSLTYFRKNPPQVGWGFVFVVASVAGAGIAALTGGEFANEWLPPIWKARFGDGLVLRAVIGFGGGLLMAFGARLAGGCTSGHGISGTMQLNPGSWITVMCLFIGGIAVAIPLFAL